MTLSLTSSNFLQSSSFFNSKDPRHEYKQYLEFFYCFILTSIFVVVLLFVFLP